jgi:fumarate hydratase, class I
MSGGFRVISGMRDDGRLYRRVPGCAVSLTDEGGRRVLRVAPDVLRRLAAEAFHDVEFHLRQSHLDGLAAILRDPAASENDRFVAGALIRNAAIAAEGMLPMCQDTGIANILAWKGEDVVTGTDDVTALGQGVQDVWVRDNLRYSVMSPVTMFREVNTGNNLPAQVDITAVPGRRYEFLFIAKGGGSSNKTFLFQESPAVLDEKRLATFLTEKMRSIGVAACPPYHLAVVIGGLSPEMTLKTVKLASAGYYDTLPTEGGERGGAFLDRTMSASLSDAARGLGLGAQFGGTHFALDIRVIRLPRHAGSCPIGIGVSCNADRNILGYIDDAGVFLEELVRDLGPHLSLLDAAGVACAVPVDLDRPLEAVRRDLLTLGPGTRVSLSGTLVVARDLAHARLHRELLEGRGVPDYFKRHPVYYAGPAKTPDGMISGSFGPTTAQRMDSFVADFMRNGAALVTIAKGGRSAEFEKARKEFGGVYLGAIGGAAALVARENIVASDILDFPELGMEAVRKIVVKDFPAFVM